MAAVAGCSAGVAENAALLGVPGLFGRTLLLSLRSACACLQLLLRPPPRELLERGPPANVRTQLQRFANRADVCRQGAAQIAHELGML